MFLSVNLLNSRLVHACILQIQVRRMWANDHRYWYMCSIFGSQKEFAVLCLSLCGFVFILLSQFPGVG